MNPLFPDISGQEYDPLWARQMAEQDIPRVPAQYQQAPNVNVGPLHLNGSGVDAASLAVLRAMQGMPQPTSGLGGLASGLVSGYAGARAGQAQSRQAANAAEDKRVLGDDIERRKQAAAYGRSLAQHRWDMQRDAAKAALEKPASEKDNLAYDDITDRKDVQTALLKRGYMLPAPNSKGRVMVSKAWLEPEKKDKGGLTDQQLFSRSARIQSEWKGNRRRETFENTQQYYARGLSESQTKDNFGDNALIRTLAKAIDDRTGVREEENKAYQAAQALRDRLKTEFTKVVNGGTLTEASRASVVNQLRILRDDAKGRYDQAHQFMRKRAQTWGLDPDAEIEDVTDRSQQYGTGGNSNGKAAVDAALGGRK